jgi:hypothetical protein
MSCGDDLSATPFVFGKNALVRVVDGQQPEGHCSHWRSDRNVKEYTGDRHSYFFDFERRWPRPKLVTICHTYTREYLTLYFVARSSRNRAFVHVSLGNP